VRNVNIKTIQGSHMPLSRSVIGTFLFLTLLTAFVVIVEKRLSTNDLDIKQLNTLFNKTEQQHETINQLKKNLKNQQEDFDALERKFTATLLNIKIGHSDPASEELVHAILALKYDTVLMIQIKIADLLKQSRLQDALALIAQTQIIPQQEKIKLVSYLQHRSTWTSFEQDLKAHLPVSDNSVKNENSYLQLLGIKIEHPASPSTQNIKKLLTFLHEKKYEEICLLRPWDSLTDKQMSFLNELCDPLANIQHVFAYDK
jgi:hypothetical protein